jgi:DHA1 family tetracycline resistance protein-like MFS transporter
MIGAALAIVGVSSMVISASIVGPFVARFGERRTLFAGLFLGALGFAVFGGARSGWPFLVAIPINCLWGLAGPSSQSMMTQRVSASEQGELQGALGAVRSIAMLVGPGIFAVTFATFIADERPVKVPGAPWYLAAALLVLVAVVARVVLPKRGSVKGAESRVAEAPTT